LGFLQLCAELSAADGGIEEGEEGFPLVLFFVALERDNTVIIDK
jgi:hypothetical protein